MDFDTYINDRRLDKNNKQKPHTIPNPEMEHALLETPENIYELLKNYKGDSRSEYEIKHDLKTRLPFYFNSDYNARLHDTGFRIITVHPYHKNKGKLGAVRHYQNGTYHLLIYPFFDRIWFKKQFNVFHCAKLVEPYPNPRYTHYYFDTLGRMIFHDDETKHFYLHGLARVAYIPEKGEILPIKPIPNGYSLSNVLDLKHYIVSDKEHRSGIINYQGRWIIEPYYSKIIYQKEKSHALVCKDHRYYTWELSTGTVTPIPFETEHFFEIEDYNAVHLRFRISRDEDIKYGIIDYDGTLICPPLYDFVEYSNSPNRHIIFEGESDFKEVPNDTHNFLTEYDFVYELEFGKYGVVDSENNVIIPAQHDYIKEINLGHYLVNDGCSIYEATTYDEDDRTEDHRIITGGNWYLYDEDGNRKKALSPEKAQQLKHEFSMNWNLDAHFSIQ